MGICKKPKTNTSYSLRERGLWLITRVNNTFTLANSQYQQHTSSGGVQGLDPRPDDWNAVPSKISGIHCECKEINTESAQVIEFLGLSVDSVAMEITNQNQINSNGSSQTSKPENSFSQHARTTTLQDECYKLCPSSRVHVLFPPANDTNQHTGAELPMLPSTSSSSSRVYGGAEMVGQQHVQMEWQNTYTEVCRSSDQFQCILGGMGCLLLHAENRGTMVPTGAPDAYQLLQTTCGNKNLCKVQDHYIHPTEN